MRGHKEAQKAQNMILGIAVNLFVLYVPFCGLNGRLDTLSTSAL
jgi:hypothetical protein